MYYCINDCANSVVLGKGGDKLVLAFEKVFFFLPYPETSSSSSSLAHPSSSSLFPPKFLHPKTPLFSRERAPRIS